MSVRVLRSLENLLEELDAKYHCVETVEIMLSLCIGSWAAAAAVVSILDEWAAVSASQSIWHYR